MGSITEVNTSSHVKTKPDLENGLALGYRSETLCNFRCVMPSRLYRTARVDAASFDDIQRLEERGIRTIIDLRPSNEAKALGLDGVGEENMKIREYFVPNLVEDLKGQGHSEGQDKVTGHVNGEISAERDKAAAKTLKGIRNRKTATHIEKIPENGSSGNLRFTAIYEPTNQSTVRGKWLFMDLMNTKVVILSMFRSLPWYLWLLGIMAVISDVIFKTHFTLRVQINYCCRLRGLGGTYCDIVDFAGPGVCKALRLLLQPGALPAAFACRYGKDRTGTMCALVQALCGVPREDIIKHYSLSQDCYTETVMRGMKAELRARNIDESYALSNPSNMVILLDWIDEKYGTVENYLTSIGFTRDEQTRLRNLMLN